MSLPPYCVHRTVEGMPEVTHERAALNMKVVYEPHTGRREVGVIQTFDDRSAFVLYLGDKHPKLTRLADLTFWEGP